MSPVLLSIPSRVSRLYLSVALMLGSMLLLQAQTGVKTVTNLPETNSAPSARSSMTTNVSPAAPTPSSVTIISTAPSKPHSDDDDDDSSLSRSGVGLALVALLIPITGIIASFATPVLIIFFYYHFRNKRRRENLALAREFLNRGMPVPPQLLDESLKYAQPGAAANPSRPGRLTDLRKGIKIISFGLAVCVVFFVFWPHSSNWAWGLIPVIIGLGFVLSGFLDDREGRRDETLPTSPGPDSSL